MTRFKEWLAQLGKRLLGGNRAPVPTLRISEFERHKLRSVFPY